MKYRKFGKLDWESSVLAVGAMRLPGFAVSNPDGIDRPEAVRVIRSAIDRGVNYVDLGFPWNMGRHEPVIRTVQEALRGGYRERVRLAMTVPACLIKSPDDFDLCLNTQLTWLGVDSVDFCLLGRLNRDNWPRLRDFGALDWLARSMKGRKFSHAGFSFHDHFQILKAILQDYQDWSICQFQYSYMDVDHDPGVSGIGYAADQGMAVVATEPLRGGRLTKQPSRAVRNAWARSTRESSLAEWGLRFVLNHSGISTVVCDASSAEQVAENLRVAEEAEPDSLTVQEEVLIGQVRDAIRKKRKAPCPSCRPCMPCPEGIDVPRFFEVYNDAIMYDDIETARAICKNEDLHPEDCVECRLCESRCAKRLPIVDWLKRGTDFLSHGKDRPPIEGNDEKSDCCAARPFAEALLVV